MKGLPVDVAATSNERTAAWISRHNEGDTVFSGVGCWALLALLASGAAGAARSELEGALRCPSNAAMKAARELFALLHSSPAVDAALGVWIRDAVSLRDQWSGGLPDGALGRLTGDQAADRSRLDRWVEEQTAGALKDFPMDMTPEIVMALASAIVVHTDWVHRFDEATTIPAAGSWASSPVQQLRSSTTELDRLLLTDNANGAVTLLRIPGSGEIDVYLALGMPGSRPGDVVSAAVLALAEPHGTRGDDLPEGSPGPGLTVQTLERSQPLDYLTIETVAFDVRGQHDLLSSAELFGLRSAMDARRGHFPGISETPLAVGQASQAARASFSATGFVAAAVTAVGAKLGAAASLGRGATYRVRHVKVTFDRPFGFLTVHRPSRLVVLGREQFIR
jgi:serine protease inhibitor